MLVRATVLALVLALETRAAAQEHALRDALSLANADECIAVEPLVAAATEWLGRETVDARIAVVVDVAAGGRAAAVIAIRDGQEIAVRRFDPLPEACADRRTVVSLGVALAIDALLLDVLEAPAPVGVAPAPEPEVERPPPPRATPIAVELEAEGGIALGAVDGISGLGAASVGLSLPPLVRLRAGVLASSVTSFALGAGAVDASLVSARVDACLVASVGVLELDGCVGVLAGTVLGNGRDFARVRSVAQPWIGAAPRLEAAIWLADPIAITLAVDGLFSFVPPTFDVTDGNGAVLHSHTLAVASLATMAGLRVRFR